MGAPQLFTQGSLGQVSVEKEVLAEMIDGLKQEKVIP
jgi:hypothetical protein